MKNIVKQFDSVASFAAYLSKAETSKTFQGAELTSQKVTKGWSELTFEEANNLLRFGDRENAEKISKEINRVSRMNGNGTRVRQQIFNDVVGHAVNVPNYLSGSPMAMINSRRVAIRNSKVLNIIYNSTFACGVKPQEVVEVGVKVLTYIKNLESSGYRVNLYVMKCAKSSKEKLSAIIRIKDSEQYLNITKTAYPMINPEFSRKHFFRMTECEVTDPFFIGTYGYVVHEQREVQDILDNLKFKVDKYLTFYEVQRKGIER